MSALVLRTELWVDRQGSSSQGEDCLVWALGGTQWASGKFYIKGDTGRMRATSRDPQPSLCGAEFLQKTDFTFSLKDGEISVRRGVERKEDAGVPTATEARKSRECLRT